MGAGAGLIGLGLQGAQAAGGGKGGGGGGGGSGGLSPQEAALAQYTMHQGLLKSQYEFGKTGTGISTMATQASGGPRLAAALQGAGISDQNQAQQGQGLQQLAQQQGSAAGTTAASGGGSLSGGDQGFSDQSGSLG